MNNDVLRIPFLPEDINEMAANINDDCSTSGNTPVNDSSVHSTEETRDSDSIVAEPPAVANNNEAAVGPVSLEKDPGSEEIPDDLHILNAPSPYAPPTNDDQQGDLQKFMEDQSKLEPHDHSAFVFMLVQATFPYWAIDTKMPYEPYLNMKARSKQYINLKIKKKMIVKEIERRDANKSKNSKNKLIPELMKVLSEVITDDIEDESYLLYCERLLREQCRAFIGKRVETVVIRTNSDDRMRVILMFQVPDIVNKYRLTQYTKKRIAMDGRKSQAYLDAEFEGTSIKLFNDKSWIPKSQALIDLHPGFEHEREYPLRDGM